MTLMPERVEPQPVNEVRGALTALAIIPVGIVAWGILWKLGVIAAIVGFVVAFGAMFLYKWGTGGRLTRVSAFVISAITLLTLGLAFFGGMVLDGLEGYSAAMGVPEFDSFFRPQFWDTFFVVLNQPGVVADYGQDFLFAAIFGLLGCFVVIRNVFKEAAAPAVAPEMPVAPGASVAPSAVADAGWNSVPPATQAPAADSASYDPEAPRP